MDNLYKCIMGKAGVGKTFNIKALIEQDSSYGILCASTGIAATNLNTTTIHSLIGFFDQSSIEDKFIEGRIQSKLRKIRENGFKYIVLDEISMFPAEVLDILCFALDQINENSEDQLGLIICGDFSQLKPISGKWAFEASSWNRFQNNIQLLTKVYRQDNQSFITALDFARDGKPHRLVEHFINLNVLFNKEIDLNFEGTTIFSKNQQVDSFNFLKINKLNTKEIVVYKKTKGRLLSEWDKIPDILKLKQKAYVMILSNKPSNYIDGVASEFEYCNGDSGYIESYDSDKEIFYIKLVRNNKIVEVPKITRYFDQKHKPSALSTIDFDDNRHKFDEDFEPYYDVIKKRWILGEVEYFPLRLSYAATVWKTQGLSLDRIQLDIRNVWWKNPNAIYVALSRARTLEGIRLVGNEKLLLNRTTIDPLVLRFHKGIKSI